MRHVRAEETLGELELDLVVREVRVSMANPGFGESTDLVTHCGRQPEPPSGIECPQSLEPALMRLQ
jgi:hypothetical protein